MVMDSAPPHQSGDRGGPRKREEEKMVRGRIVFPFLFSGGSVFLDSTSAQQKDASRAGWISDEACAAERAKPGRADGVQKCWRGGAAVGHRDGNHSEPSLSLTMTGSSGLSIILKRSRNSLPRKWC
jgi:hypothetical protein